MSSGEGVHRAIVVVDVEGYTRRTDREQQVVRAGMYRALEQAFHRTGLPWDDYQEDRGDGVFILTEAPHSRLVESLPVELVAALAAHNRDHDEAEQIRLRMVLNAGRVHFDGKGVSGAAVNHAFRLLDAAVLKGVLSQSSGMLALIVSASFYHEVVRHCAPAIRGGFHQVRARVRDIDATAWVCLPNDPEPAALVPGLNVLSTALLDLLWAQRAVAEELPYRLLSDPQPPLSEVYVEQRAEQGVERRDERRSDAGAVDRDAGEQRGGVAEVDPVVRVRSVPEVLRAQRHAVVVGEPGSGKSTLLQRLVEESAAWLLSAPADANLDTAPCGRVLPVRVAATALTGQPFTEALASGLRMHLGAYPIGSVTPDLFTARPAEGVDWLVLVDGLDEILDSRERRAVIAALAQRATGRGDADAGYRFLVTSRPLPDQELAPLRVLGAGQWRLRLFDRDDLEVFARGWFRARHRQDAEREARRFLELVERSRLQAITRIPLLATITAVVYEQRAEIALPVSQAALYEEFLRYLLQLRQETVQVRRELRKHLAPYSSSAEQLADWLFEHLRPLLEYLAAEFLSDRDGRLPELAVSWTAEHYPALPRQVPDWDRRVMELLRGTGVLLQRDGNLEFLHHSFAEYLAASVDARDLDPRSWRSQALNPATQNRALFTLARWAGEPPGRDPTSLMEPLLRRRDDEDLLLAAAVLAHGIDLPIPVETAVVDSLLTGAHGIAHSADFFAALGRLPGRPAVTDGLASLMTDPKTRAYTRVAAAQAYASLTDPAPALSALADIARDLLHTVGDRVQAARALGDLGERATAVQVLTSIAHDPTAGVGERVLAADKMAVLGETAAALKVLTGIAHDLTVDAGDRVQSARALGDLGERATAVQVLTSIAYDPGTRTLARIWAARDLAKLGRSEIGIEVLAGIVLDPNTTVFQLDAATRRLAKLGEAGTGGTDVLADITRDPHTDTFDRILAARELAELGKHTLVRAILRLILRSRVSSSNRTHAARALAHAGDRDTAIEELRRLARSWRSDAWTRVDAAEGLADLGERTDAAAALTRTVRTPYVSGQGRARAARKLADLGQRDQAVAALRRIMRSSRVTAFSRACAAQDLADLGEPEEAMTVLRGIMRRWYVTTNTRAWAARDLAELGERDAAVAVLTRLVRRRRGGTLHTLGQITAARALAKLGERDLALRTLTDIAYRTSGFSVSAAGELAELGERETARQALIIIIRRSTTKPEQRLWAAEELSRQWGPILAADLLTSIANDRRGSAKIRVRAAADLAKIRERTSAVTTLESIAGDSSDNPIARLRAATVLIQWKVLNKM